MMKETIRFAGQGDDAHSAERSRLFSETLPGVV